MFFAYLYDDELNLPTYLPNYLPTYLPTGWMNEYVVKIDPKIAWFSFMPKTNTHFQIYLTYLFKSEACINEKLLGEDIFKKHL